MLEDLFAKISKEREDFAQKEIDYVIVGLGNPGKKYERTWHNLGFLCLDILAARHNFRCDTIRFKGLIADTRLFGGRQIWLKPQTYMNNSGESVRDLLNFYKIPPERCMIILDDIDLDLGVLRIRKNGSAGTHNGMRSVIYQTGSDQMMRLRVGFGPKPAKIDIINYVLSKIPEEQEELCRKSLEHTADAVELIIKEGPDMGMSKMNGSCLKA